VLGLALDLLAAGLAIGAYALGARIFLGHCQRVAPRQL
jgi:hypothetical protein